LLAGQLGITLQAVGSGNRRTFAAGEAALSEWMARNAFVTWHAQAEPWLAEEELIRSVSLPLNVDMNRTHPFCSVLANLRRSAKQAACTDGQHEDACKPRVHTIASSKTT
jgi:hypothetical protein